MNTLFEENYKIYRNEIKLYLSRSIFEITKMRCCLDTFRAMIRQKEMTCPFSYTEDHIYRRRVANALEEVISVCNMLCASPILLNTYSRSILWDRFFSQSVYIKYHLEQWYINVIRLEDMYLILLNEVFQLGIKKELVGYEIISTNNNLPNNIRDDLRALHKSCRPARAARIMIIHHQTLFEEKLSEIEHDENLIQILKDAGKDRELAESLEEIQDFAKIVKVPMYKKKKIGSILISNNNLLRCISNMLLSLEFHYTNRHKLLTNKRK